MWKSSMSLDPEEPLGSVDEAIAYFLKVSGGRAYKPISGGEGKIGEVVEVKGRPYYVFFTRDWFRSFSNFFPRATSKRTWGQGIDLDRQEDAVKDNAVIALVLPDRKIYICEAHRWDEFVKEHRTIHRPKGESKDKGCVPASLLHRYPAESQPTQATLL